MNINNLKIVSWNARGIRNKINELFHFLENQNFDVCLLNETWLDSSCTMKHRNFFCYRNDRQNSRGGGVAILIKKNIAHQLLPAPNTSLIESIGIKIFCENDSINIYSCYFPGGNTSCLRKQLFSSDLRKLTSSNNKFILGGDFNCRHSYWGCYRRNTWGNLLYEKLNTLQILFSSDNSYIPQILEDNLQI